MARRPRTVINATPAAPTIADHTHHDLTARVDGCPRCEHLKTHGLVPRPAEVKVVVVADLLIPQRARPYTADELQAAFDEIKNVRDWKAPISKTLPADRVIGREGLLASACVHFTATTLHFREVGPGRWYLSADGYRMGPAGDH